jgi:hypothetical protein
MNDTENNVALNIYFLGWLRGDSAIIYWVVDYSYTCLGLPNMEPINKMNFKMFWMNFRSNIVDCSGPNSVSGDLMKLKNTICRNVSSLSSIHLNSFV